MPRPATAPSVRYLKKEEDKTLPKNRLRNKLYFKGGPLVGPFDPDAPLHAVPLTVSEAFAPTPQFIQVGAGERCGAVGNEQG